MPTRLPADFFDVPGDGAEPKKLRAKPRRLESRLQQSVVKFCRHCIEGPHFVMAFDRAENRGGDAHLWEQKRGVLPGTPDVVALVTNGAVWMELKAGDNQASVAQEYIGREIAAIRGHWWFVIRSVEDACKTLSTLGIRLIPSAWIVAMDYDAKLAAKAAALPGKKRSRTPRAAPVTKRALANARTFQTR